MYSTYAKLCLIPAIVLFLAVPSLVGAKVEWSIQNTIKTGEPPVDVAVSPNGSAIFVLTSNGSVLIYDRQGKLDGTIKIGVHVDQIRVGPSGEQLFATSRQNQTVEVIALNFIRKINVMGSPSKGRKDAPVIIAVFSDFQWAYCARLVPELEQLLEKYPTEVRIVFKNFPIRSHKYAIKAAIAALAADRQDKFWEFHDELFNNYNRLNDQKIQEIVKQLNLDQTKFDENKKNPVEAARVRQDYEEGIRLGVRGTPTVFINGKKLKDRSLKNMEAVIEEELKANKK